MLLAACDANYCFRLVDIGAYGRQSDGGIFRNSKMFRKFENKEFDIPSPREVCTEGPALPFVMIGDEAFPLANYLMRPYPGKNGLSPEQETYNYRLSRARRTIENAFGILASEWRIFRKPIQGSLSNIEKMIQATICLHNWLRTDRKSQYAHYENVGNSSLSNSEAFVNFQPDNSNDSESAEKIRNKFKNYLYNDSLRRRKD